MREKGEMEKEKEGVDCEVRFCTAAKRIEAAAESMKN